MGYYNGGLFLPSKHNIGTKTMRVCSLQIGTLVIKECREVLLLSVAVVILDAVFRVFLHWTEAPLATPAGVNQ